MRSQFSPGAKSQWPALGKDLVLPLQAGRREATQGKARSVYNTLANAQTPFSKTMTWATVIFTAPEKAETNVQIEQTPK